MHFLVTGSSVVVLSVFSRSSVGELRQGIREGKETAILRKSTLYNNRTQKRMRLDILNYLEDAFYYPQNSATQRW